MSLLRHSIGISASQFTEKLLSFAVIIIASRVFHSEGVGEFFYYFSLVSLFIPLMDMGFDKLLLQRWWKFEAFARRVLLSRLILMKCILGSAALCAAIITDMLVRWGEGNPKAITGAFLAIFLEQFGRLLRRPAQAHGSSILDVTIPVFARVLTLTGLLVSFGRIEHGYQIAYIYAAANGIGAVISLLGLRGCFPSHLAGVTFHKLWELGKAGLPFSLSHLFVMMSLFVDSVILGHFGFSQVGYYNAAYRVILVVVGLSGGACYALFPRMAQAQSDGDAKSTGRLLAIAVRVHLMLFGAMGIGGLVLGEKLMITLYGSGFAASVLPFRILCGLVVVASLTNLMSHTIEAVGHQHRAMSVHLVAASFNLVTNLIFIPIYGMIGAAVTTLCTECLSLTIFTWKIRKNQNIAWSTNGFGRGLIFLAIITILFIPLGWLNLWIAMPLGMGIFAAVLILFRNYWLIGIRKTEDSPAQLQEDKLCVS